MNVLLALLALLGPRVAPDRSFDPYSEGLAPVGGPAVRQAASESETARVAELLHRQDEAILTHRLELVKQDFEPDYNACDFHCDSGEQLLARLDAYVREHRDAKLSSDVLRAERLGDWIVADVRRRFSGVRLHDDAPVSDEQVETQVLHDVDGRLRLSATYENESCKAGRVDRERRVYDARAQLRYQVALPEPFVPVPRRGPGAALDELFLLDPADDATIGLVLFEPTLDRPLLDLITSDATDPDAAWRIEPRRYDRAPLGFASAFEAEFEYAARPEKGRQGRAAVERFLYLSPDGRVVFALWLRAAPESFPKLKPKLDQLARSIRLFDVAAGRPYSTALLDANPRWNTLSDKRAFRTGAAPVELVIPSGLAATPLLGDHVIRLRLRLLEDPRSSLLVRFFPAGEDRMSPEKILEHTLQRMEAFACAEGQGGDTHRSNGTMQVLGHHGDLRSVEILCRDGTRRNYQIVAVDVGDCHVQVQVLPGSDQVELQSAALKKVLDGLRLVSPAAAAPVGSAKPDDGHK